MNNLLFKQTSSLNISALTCDTSGTYLAALGFFAASTPNYSVYTSNDGGYTWIQKFTLGSITTGIYIFSISNNKNGNGQYIVIGTGQIIGLGGNGIYISSNYGNNWTQVFPTPLSIWISIAVSSSGQYMYALGQNSATTYKIWYSSNYGSSWTSDSGFTLNNFPSVVCNSTGQYVGIATIGGNIYISSNYGQNFNSTASSQNWQSIDCNSNGNIFIAAETIPTNTPGRIYISQDYGSNWIITSAPTEYWGSVISNATGSILTGLTKNGLIYMSTDTGASWNLMYTLNILNEGFYGYGIVTNSTGNFYAVASYNTNPGIYITYPKTNFIVNGVGDLSSIFLPLPLWTLQPGSTKKTWSAITCSIDGSIIYAASQDVYKSSDNGNTWQFITTFGFNCISIACSSDGQYVAAVILSNDYIQISNDAGSTWSQTATITFWQSIAMSPSGKYLIAGRINDTLCISEDYGETWSSTLPGVLQDWITVDNDSSGQKLFAAAYGECVYISLDKGVNWQQQSSLGLKNWRAIRSNDDGTICYIINNDEKTVYVGIYTGPNWTWNQYNVSTDFTYTGFSLACSSNGNKLIISSPDYLYISINGGVTWNKQNISGITSSWGPVAISYNGYYLIAGNGDIFNGGGYIYTLNATITNPTGFIANDGNDLNNKFQGLIVNPDSSYTETKFKINNYTPLWTTTPGTYDLGQIFVNYAFPYSVTGNPNISTTGSGPYTTTITFIASGTIVFFIAVNNIQYIVTGGGGKGGNGPNGNVNNPASGGGGGGGGGTNIGTFNSISYLEYTITVGGSGTNSSISNIITSNAGNGGGNGSTSGTPGGKGGSGGGGTNPGSNGQDGFSKGTFSGGAGGAGGTGYTIGNIPYGNGGNGGKGGDTDLGTGQPGSPGGSGVVSITFTVNL
jgi:hypothetical protein